MRRVPALLLVAVFSFLLIGPAVWMNADSNLPACCRRGGKHHCAMMDADGAPSPSPAVKAPVTRCPLFPKGGVALPYAGAALLSGGQPVGQSMGGQMALPVGALGEHRLSLDRSHLTRGPPRLFS